MESFQLIALNLYVKVAYAEQVMARKKLYDQDISFYLCKVLYFANNTLKFTLYSEYYYDLQEKGLKMKAKKKITRLMIGMR